MFFLPTNSCAALFYAVRQFYAKAIFVMGRLDTYGVGQKQWGGCELTRQATPLLLSHCSIRSKRLTMIFLLSSGGKTSMTVLIPLEETSLGFHPSFSRHDRDQTACLCSCGLTQTFNLCILSPPSTENIRCALLSPVLFSLARLIDIP